MTILAPDQTLDLCRRELLKGCTDTLILSLLAETPMYGYQLGRELDQRSGGYFRLKEGTLYPAFHRLERDGLVEGRWEQAESGQSRRYYHIMPAGRHRLKTVIEEWSLFTKAVNQIAQPLGAFTEVVSNGNVIESQSSIPFI